MKGGSRRVFTPSGVFQGLALSFVVAASGCTNDYGAFDLAGGSAGGSAGSVAPRDSGIDQSSTGAGGSEDSDGELEAADEEPADVGAEAVADASDARADAEASSDAPADGPADAPSDGPTDAPSDVVDAPAEAPSDAPSDAGTDAVEVGSDAPAEADAPVEVDVAPADAPTEADVSVAPDATDADATEAAQSCGSGTKPCNNGCVDVTDPATGCGGVSCAPCALPHASATCDVTGACAVLVCGSGFEDCDTMAANGCEAQLSSDVGNCGSCGRACAGNNVLSKECAGGLCVPTCSIGHTSCSSPVTGADDGCEQGVDDSHCGGCANDCTAQGGGLKCGVAGVSQCGCTGDDDCRVMGSMGTCDLSIGLCTCGATTCKSGEACQHVPGPPPDICSCNGGTACGTGEICCQSPAGCRDLQTDPSDCGACGRSCPIGFFCSAGQCQCSGDFECNAGGAGTCAAGQCVCGGITCAKGQRCQPGGSCG